MNLNKTVKSAAFAATAIGLGYMFLLVPNVEFISVTVFLSGLYLGAFPGLFVGGCSIMIYSVLNPLGSGLAFLPLLFSQVFAMAGIGVFGYYFGKIIVSVSSKNRMIISVIVGFLCTIWYDFITTISFPLSAGYGYKETLVYGIAGLFFTLLHLISNSFIFMIVVPKFIERAYE